MFDTLLSSRPSRPRRVGQATVSILFHTLVIVGAVKATQAAATEVTRSTGPQIEFLTPSVAVPEPMTTAVAAVPAAPQFQELTPPIELPLSIPPVVLEDDFDPARYSGSTSADSSLSRIVGPSIRLSPPAGGGSGFTDRQVDERAVRIGGPSPVYPEVMRAVGIDGQVRVRFVVGLDGRAESESIQVIRSTNRAFERQALLVVAGSLFRPAILGGEAVRQQVEINIRFTIAGQAEWASGP